MKDMIWRVDMEYKIYASSSGEICEYASFENDGYVEQILAKIEKRRLDGRCDNADVVMERVFAKKQGILKKDFKTAMRALRHFDEVGLSNDVYSVLEEINDDGSFDAVFFDDFDDPTSHIVSLNGLNI